VKNQNLKIKMQNDNSKISKAWLSKLKINKRILNTYFDSCTLNFKFDDRREEHA